ncbi:MAG: hypothetical protein M1823_007729, partial [Watsoniomyces obsoletus]
YPLDRTRPRHDSLWHGQPDGLLQRRAVPDRHVWIAWWRECGGGQWDSTVWVRSSVPAVHGADVSGYRGGVGDQFVGLCHGGVVCVAVCVLSIWAADPGEECLRSEI